MHPASDHLAAYALLSILAAFGLRLAFKMLRLVLVLAVPAALYLLHPPEPGQRMRRHASGRFVEASLLKDRAGLQVVA